MKLLLAVIFCFFAFILHAQFPALPMQVSNAGEAAAIATYRSAVEDQKPVYTGPWHVDYPAGIEGSPYVMGDAWKAGAVRYDGISYVHEMLKYDALKGTLVLKRPDGFAIELRKDKVASFTIADAAYLHIQDIAGLEPDFYQLLSEGPLRFLAHERAKLSERTENNKITQLFEHKLVYYGCLSGAAVQVRSLRSALALTENKKAGAQQALKKSGIRYKKNPAAALKVIANYYNQNSN